MPRSLTDRPIRTLCLLAALALSPVALAAQDPNTTTRVVDDDDGFDDWGLLGLLGLAGLLGRKRDDRDRVVDTTRPRV